MFAGGIVRSPFLRTNRSLSGYAALQLTPDFLGTALFERISTSTGEKRARAEKREGFHLLMLENDRGIAIAEWEKGIVKPAGVAALVSSAEASKQALGTSASTT